MTDEFHDPARPGENPLESAIDSEFKKIVEATEEAEHTEATLQFAMNLGKLRVALKCCGFEHDESYELVRDVAQQVMAKQVLDTMFLVAEPDDSEEE